MNDNNLQVYLQIVIIRLLANCYHSFFNSIVCNLYCKIVLILLLFEAGDIEMNPGPITINNSPSIYTATLEVYAMN